MDSFSGGSVRDYGLVNILMMDLFLKNTQLFTLQDLMDWSHVDYCDVFISCLNSHSDGTHSLQSESPVTKRCNANFLQICSD